jgi:WD40 repeat protein
VSIKSIVKRQFKLTDRKLLSEYIRDMVWSPDGNCLAMISAAGELAIWREGKLDLLSSKSNYSLDCLGFSANGQWLTVAGQAGVVQLWKSHANTFKPVAFLEHRKAWIDSLAWSPKQNLLAYAVNRKIKIWDAHTQTIIASLDFKNSSVFNLAWHPQGNLLAASGHGGVKVWQIKNWTQKPYLLQVPGASLNCAWSSDGTYLASGNLDRTLSILQWDNPPPWLMQGFPGKISQVTWSQNNAESLLAASCQEGISVWQYNSKKWLSYILKHQKTVKAIAFAPDSSILASTGDDSYIRLWQGKKLIQTLEELTNGFSCLAWHPTGKYLAAGGQQGELIIWQQSFSGKGFSN